MVGAAGLRDCDEDFPAVGSRFHHKVGSWPIGLNDHTEVLEHEPTRRIVLKAKARPLGTATIAIDLAESAGGTELTMEETPGDRLTALVAGNPLADTALRIRNAEALARLKRLVEGVPAGDPIAERPLARQRVLITGGSSGIGLAVAEALVGEGAEVALLARNELGLAAAKRRLAEHGAEASHVAADVTDHEALAAGVERAATELGGIDVIVTSAASISFGRFTETDAGDFEATIETVLGGTIATIREALPHPRALARRGGGGRLDRRPDALWGWPPTPPPSTASSASSTPSGSSRGERFLGDPVDGQPRCRRHPALEQPRKLDRAAAARTPFPAVYSPESVAEAVLSVIRHPRDELTAGGLARAQVIFYSLFGAAGKRAMQAVARLEHTAGDRPAGEGGLRGGKGAGETEGGFGGRPSAAVKALGAWDGMLRAIGRD